MKICVMCGAPFEPKGNAVRCPECRKRPGEELKQRHAEQRRAEHRCEKCGRQDERTMSGKARCQNCIDIQNRYRPHADNYHANRYYAWKAEKCCVKCGTQDERTLSGKALCERCSNRASKHAHKAYVKRREARMCTWCSTPLPAGWFYVLCPECQEKSKSGKVSK